jgi:hypothetical protein
MIRNGDLMPPQLHDDYRHEADAVLAALREEYSVAGPVRVDLYEPEPGDLSLGNSDTPHVISLNAYWFAAPRHLFHEAVIAGRAATRPGLPRWHGSIGDLAHEFARLITHEFAHHLMSALSEPAAKFACERHAAAVAEPTLAVSGYALCDADEWAAETFAAARLGGAGSPQVAEMLKFLGSKGGSDGLG